MSLLKQVEDKNANLAWSPVPDQGNLVALGTRDGGGGGFDDYGGELEIHKLDFGIGDTRTKVMGTVRTNGRFTALAWSALNNKRADFALGVVAGGLADGTVAIWDPAKLVANHPQPRIAAVQRHTGPVNGLHFNPSATSSHLLASGGADNEVFVYALDRPDTPNVFIPAPAPNTAKHTAEVSKVAWNPQVPHILASCSGNGSSIVWDLRQKKPYCELRDPARGPVADIAWNPDEGLHMVTASGDDNNPVIRLWDLRSSTTHPLATLKGHDQGLLSVSWCPFDSSFLLSTGRDNRTLLWDLHHASPIYELPSSIPEAGSTGYGGYGASQQRRYNATWSPILPAVVGTSSFNRTVEFYSLTGVRSTTGRAPKWLRRPVAASFGWGGQLVHVDNGAAAKTAKPAGAPGAPRGGPGGKKPMVHLRGLVEDTELVAASKEFKEIVLSQDYPSFCAARASAAKTGEERQVWAVLQTIVDKESKSQLNHTLGYDGASIAAAAAAATAALRSKAKTPSPAGAAPPIASTSHSRSSSTASGGLGAAEGWGDLGDEVDGFSAPASGPGVETVTGTLAGLRMAGKATPYPEAEAHVKRALLAGGLEAAVQACLEHDLVAEALLLASAPDADPGVWARTKDAYVSRHAGQRPLLRIIDAVLKSDMSELVGSSDLIQWQETLALLNTYTTGETFAGLTELLGTRLETERRDRASATLCYLCSLNIGKAVRFWVDTLQEAKQRLGRTDTLALHHFVEKVTICLSAAEQQGQAPVLPADVAVLFTEYAEILAAQGELDMAYTFVKNIPDPSTALLKDRLFRASITLQANEPEPAGPFDIKHIGMTPASPTRTAVPATVPVGQHQEHVVTAAPSAYGQQKPSLGAGASGAGAAAASPHALPPHWVAVTDPSSGQVYFYNESTRETSWEKPVVAAAPIHVPAAVPAAQASYGGMPPTQQQQSQMQQPAHHPATLSGTKPLDYYADSFTSSHGNAALMQKYGNVGSMPQQPHIPQQQQQQQFGMEQQQPSMVGGIGMNMGMGQPTVFQPNKVPQNPNPTPVAAPTKPPSPVMPAAPAEPPAEALPILANLNNLVSALAASSALSAGDKRQLNDVTKGIAALSNKLGLGEVGPDVLVRVGQFADCCFNRDFASATAIQSEFTLSIWDTQKEWIKPLKLLIMLGKKGF
ncbi:secretory protein sec31 [Nannochloropsis oceanica]